MDESLNTLDVCEKLSIATNEIDRIINLKIRSVKILSLGRNNIKKIQGLDDIGQTLEQLWLNYNQIEKLDGLKNCVKLHTLFISNNKIKVWDEVAKLAQLPELKNALMMHNPFYSDGPWEEVAPLIIKRVP